MSECYFCGRIAAIKRGEDSMLVAELPESYVVLSDEQYYRGYCILVLKEHAEQLHLLSAERQRRISDEYAKVGAAIERVCHAPRLNYACLGNMVPHIHWHVIPRYHDDPLFSSPSWVRPVEERRRALSAEDLSSLRDALRRELGRDN